MKKLFGYTLLALFALLPLTEQATLYAAELPTDISQKSKPATLKIRLVEQAEKVVLEVKGSYEIFDPYSHFPLTSGLFGKRKILIDEEEGMHWGERLPGIHHIRIVPRNGESTILVNGIECRGCMEVYSLNGLLTVINEVDMESYLKSILSVQVPTCSEQRLLEAIAIIARTHAYYLAERDAQAKWHVTAEEVQYYGYGMTLQNIAIDRAVENTRYIVMTFQNHPFASTWTENSAGRTASYAHIFRKQVITPHGVTAPLAAKARSNNTWSLTLSTKEIAHTFGLDKLTAIHPYLDQDSQKVYALQLSDGVVTKNIDFFTLQQKIGNHKLRSNDFTVVLQGDKIIFKGWGQGHGVGLCLYSARLLAERGEGLVSILTQFFPHMEMQQLRTLPRKITGR